MNSLNYKFECGSNEELFKYKYEYGNFTKNGKAKTIQNYTKDELIKTLNEAIKNRKKLSLEVLLYDAYRGNNTSIAELITFYSNNQNKLEPKVEQPIKRFVLSRLMKLIQLEIEPKQLLNPLGGDIIERISPSINGNNRSVAFNSIRDIQLWTNCSRSEALEIYNRNMKIPLSLRTIQIDKKIIIERTKRLKFIERCLSAFYLHKNNKKILRQELNNLNLIYKEQHVFETKEYTFISPL